MGMLVQFSKWHGCGNDFVLLDDSAGAVSAISAAQDRAALARRICRRRYGVGADGLILIEPSQRADWRMRIYNADGSEAEMCGNGIRCFARRLRELGLITGDSCSVETGAGVLLPRLLPDGAVRVDMGEPILESARVPTQGFPAARVINEPLALPDGTVFHVTCVSMGNPHCVIFTPHGDFADALPERWGAILEQDAHFPRRTNVEFVTVRQRTCLRMRVWERGAAVTPACGTGACATLVAAVLNDKVDREALVLADGGELRVAWDAADNHVYMTGAAVKVFEGEWEL